MAPTCLKLVRLEASEVKLCEGLFFCRFLLLLFVCVMRFCLLHCLCKFTNKLIWRIKKNSEIRGFVCLDIFFSNAEKQFRFWTRLE